MQAYLIYDGEFLTTRQQAIRSLLLEYLGEYGYHMIEETLERDKLAFCRGCFDCWVKTPGECIMRDQIAQINRNCMTSDVVIYLCPVVFGQFSANMKFAIDRWLPNMMPYFMTRKDGSTMHTARYRSYPAQVFLGYGEHLSEREKQIFADIIQKHRSNTSVVINCGDDEEIRNKLRGFSLRRQGAQL